MLSERTEVIRKLYKNFTEEGHQAMKLRFLLNILSLNSILNKLSVALTGADDKYRTKLGIILLAHLLHLS